MWLPQKKLPLLIFFGGLFFSALILWSIQFSTRFVIGADGNLHGYFAQLILRQGFIKNFPGASFSWFVTKFSDKDFVYHLISLMPVALFGPQQGIKLMAVSAAILLSAIYLFLVRKLSLPVQVAGILLFFSSASFLRDISEARPIPLAIAATLVGIELTSQKNYRLLFFLSLFYSMLHLSAWVFIIFVFVYSVGLWIKDRSDWKSLQAAVIGFLLGFLIHPNFPNNVFYWYLNGILVPYYAVRGGVLELGAEFFPISTRELAFRYAGWLLIPPVSITALNLRIDKWKKEILTWGLAFLLYGFLGVFSQRNLTHTYVIGLIFMLYLADNLLSRISSLRSVTRDRIYSIIALFITGYLFFAATVTINSLAASLKADYIYSAHFNKVAEFIKNNIPVGQRIFHTNWSDSQFLIGMAGNYQYLVTLDPVYMYSYKPGLYELYRNVSFGRIENPAEALVSVFGTSYGYAGKNYFSSFIENIRNDPAFEIIMEDEIGIVFRVINPKG